MSVTPSAGWREVYRWCGVTLPDARDELDAADGEC